MHKDTQKHKYTYTLIHNQANTDTHSHKINKTRNIHNTHNTYKQTTITTNSTHTTHYSHTTQRTHTSHKLTLTNTDTFRVSYKQTPIFIHTYTLTYIHT